MTATIGKAERIELFSFSTPQMRAFHVTWLAFFAVFFSWFAIAPLMSVVRGDLGLTPAQVANASIVSVAGTVFMRLLIGPLCERWGARLTYTVLLVVGSIPVMAIGLARDYTTFLFFRLAIGMIGASFVITQYHMSVMFGPKSVGTANATTAGWGNMGGGVTQMVMPLVLAGVLGLGATQATSWRLAMVFPGLFMLVMGFAYWRLTQDAPGGNYRDLRREGKMPPVKKGGGLASLAGAARDPRVWALFAIYAVCFGIELTIDNVAALYFHDTYALDLRTAGLAAGIPGMMSLFARALGGFLSDRASVRWGPSGRVWLLFAFVLCEGIALVLFSRAPGFGAAIATIVLFSLFVKMAEGGTYGLVPFVGRGAPGSVAGIVGAGGNAGAIAIGFLFKIEGLTMRSVFGLLGVAIALVSVVALTIRFPEKATADAPVAALPEPAPELAAG
jgi:MFS transporter, NNP family, nitrate/nitrite transporter